MKAATFGLVFGALSIANAQLFEDEDTLLQEEWEDVDADRELQFNPNTPGVLTEAEFAGEGEGPGPLTEAELAGEFDGDVVPEPGVEPPLEEEGDAKRKWRRNRRRNKRRKNRKNRKGRKGKKGKKGPFNIEDYKEKLAKRSAKMVKKLAKKCKKRAEMAEKFCVEKKNDDDDCGVWQSAMKAKCDLDGKCKAETKHKVAECTGDFKQMMASFKYEEINPDGRTHASVGACFKDTLKFAETCHADAKSQVEEILEPVGGPSDEELKAFKEEMKALKKAARDKKRQARKNKRRNRKNNRRNNRKNNRRNNRRNNRLDTTDSEDESDE